MLKKELYVNVAVEENVKKFVSAIAEINKAISEDASQATVDSKIENAKEQLKTLNASVRDSMFAYLRKQENAMAVIIEELTYEAYALKKITDNEAKTVTYESAVKAVRIDACRFENFCGTLIGNATGWRYRADDFARYLATRKAKEIGADWKSVAANFKLRTKTERTDIKDPTSMNTLIEKLQEVLDAMYFTPYVDKDGNVHSDKNLYKITSKDVAFVLGRAYGESRQLLTVATLKKPMDGVVNIVLEVLNHLVFDNPYNVEYKAQ